VFKSNWESLTVESLVITDSLTLQSTSGIVLPSGEYVCNKRKNNTTHNLHALVHHVYVISKEDPYFAQQYWKQQLLMHSLYFISDMFKNT